MQPYPRLKAALTVGALAVAAVHMWVPSINVDAITVTLLATAVLPWLQPIFKSVKLPGGIEIVLQELKQEIKDASGAAHSAERKADLAVSGIAGGLAPQPEANPNEWMLALSRKYVDIRTNQVSGSARTQAMTAVVRAMIDLASSLPELDVVPLLRSKDSGQRLAAYAYLYAAPNSRHLEALVSSVTALEDKPFGQYWGLQAVGRNLETGIGDSTSKAIRQDLVAFAVRVPRGSDRDYEVRKIIAQLSLSA
ncbi:hypothetical protein D3C76_341000 [compost metagenome]